MFNLKYYYLRLFDMPPDVRDHLAKIKHTQKLITARDTVNKNKKVCPCKWRRLAKNTERDAPPYILFLFINENKSTRRRWLAHQYIKLKKNAAAAI